MKDIIVFDIETQKSFDEVGGRDKLHLLGISVVAAYSYLYNKTFVFEEKNVKQFQKMLDQASLLIGFNSHGFDEPILRHYEFNLDNIGSLDLMDDVKKGAGFRVSLDNIANTTLGLNKIADGLQAIKWYKEGNMEEIKKYCVSDVLITKDIYEYGKNKSHIFFTNREKQKVAVPVFWSKEKQKGIPELLREAFQKRKSAEIDYITQVPQKKSDPVKNLRLIDIYSINNSVVEAFCHLRQEKRVFKIDRILSVAITNEDYKTVSDVQSALM